MRPPDVKRPLPDHHNSAHAPGELALPAKDRRGSALLPGRAPMGRQGRPPDAAVARRCSAD
eukprot:1896421-Prymnesium_polylepis.2